MASVGDLRTCAGRMHPHSHIADPDGCATLRHDRVKGALDAAASLHRRAWWNNAAHWSRCGATPTRCTGSGAGDRQSRLASCQGRTARVADKLPKSSTTIRRGRQRPVSRPPVGAGTTFRTQDNDVKGEVNDHSGISVGCEAGLISLRLNMLPARCPPPSAARHLWQIRRWHAVARSETAIA
jgi:hypothetical protein